VRILATPASMRRAGAQRHTWQRAGSGRGEVTVEELPAANDETISGVRRPLPRNTADPRRRQSIALSSLVDRVSVPEGSPAIRPPVDVMGKRLSEPAAPTEEDKNGNRVCRPYGFRDVQVLADDSVISRRIKGVQLRHLKAELSRLIYAFGRRLRQPRSRTDERMTIASTQYPWVHARPPRAKQRQSLRPGSDRAWS
jgi:hypothetical protein